MKALHLDFILATFIMSLIMSGSLSLANILLEAGFQLFNPLEWIQKWCYSLLIAQPLSMAASPLIKRFVNHITR